jgi:hypothetical protein
MKFRLLALPVFLLLLSVFTGCSTVQVDRKPSTDLSKLQHFFVEHRLNDNHGIDLLIVEELKKLGKDTSVGPMTMLPDNAEAIVAYDDDWTFDFTTHLTTLQIRVRDARKDTQLASGSFFQRSVTRDAPADIVHRVVTSIFAPK